MSQYSFKPFRSSIISLVVLAISHTTVFVNSSYPCEEHVLNYLDNTYANEVFDPSDALGVTLHKLIIPHEPHHQVFAKIISEYSQITHTLPIRASPIALS